MITNNVSGANLKMTKEDCKKIAELFF